MDWCWLVRIAHKTNATGNESWSSRDFAKVLDYVNYRHFPLFDFR